MNCDHQYITIKRYDGSNVYMCNNCGDETDKCTHTWMIGEGKIKSWNCRTPEKCEQYIQDSLKAQQVRPYCDHLWCIMDDRAIGGDVSYDVCYHCGVKKF